MWMWYAEESRPQAHDVRSAVERLYSRLMYLEFDASHGMVYGLEQFDSNDRIEVIRKRYSEGVEVCETFLNNSVSIQFLITKLIELGLDEFTTEIEEFIAKDDAKAGRENKSESGV